MAVTNPFIEELLKRNWKFLPSATPQLQIFPPRYKSIPEEIRRFVASYQTLCNDKEDQWLLSANDYNTVGSEGFNWNEFELMSIQAAGEDLAWLTEIKSFWSANLPLYVRVDGDYEYAAYCCSGANSGCFVQGLAPDFETVNVIAHNFLEFQEWVLNAST